MLNLNSFGIYKGSYDVNIGGDSHKSKCISMKNTFMQYQADFDSQTKHQW